MKEGRKRGRKEERIRQEGGGRERNSEGRRTGR
jgi:hypothetical protein